MRRLAKQILDLLRLRPWQRQELKRRGRTAFKLELEPLEERVVLATSVAQVLPAALTGTAFLDSNHNNVFDSSDLLLPGATVSLSGTDLNGKAVSASAVTNSQGIYKFLQVNPGNYQLSLSTNGSFVGGGGTIGSGGGLVSGTVLSAIAISQGQTLVNYNLAVEGLSSTGVSLRDFMNSTLLINGIPVSSNSSPLLTPGTGLGYADGGAAPPAFLTAAGTGALSGTVKTNAAAAVKGVTIALTGITGGGANAGLPTFITTTTDASGAYSFSNLAAGTYTLNVVSQPSGFRAGTPVIGSLDGYIKQNDTLAAIDVTTTAGTGYNFVEIPVTLPSGTAVEAHLVDDTGSSTTDGVTSDPTVAGSILNVSGVTAFTGVVDATVSVPIVSLMPYLKADGTFYLSRGLMTQLIANQSGNPTQGVHTLHLEAFGANGTLAAATDLIFTLDTTTPAVPAVHLDTVSDPSQTGRTAAPGAVTVMGHTDPNSHVVILATDASGNATTGVVNPNPVDTTSGDFSFQETLVAGTERLHRRRDRQGRQYEPDACYFRRGPGADRQHDSARQCRRHIGRGGPNHQPGQWLHRPGYFQHNPSFRDLAGQYRRHASR